MDCRARYVCMKGGFDRALKRTFCDLIVPDNYYFLWHQHILSKNHAGVDIRIARFFAAVGLSVPPETAEGRVAGATGELVVGAP